MKRYANHLVIIFKSAEEHHLQFIDAFNDKEHVYLNQDCIAVNQRAFVWLNTMRYLNNEDADTISALQAIKENSKLDLVAEQEDYHEHVFNKSELRNLECSDELIFNTDKIAQICTAELNYHQSLLPQFQTPNGETSKIYLWQNLKIS